MSEVPAVPTYIRQPRGTLAQDPTTRAQRAFFRRLAKSLDAGQPIPVDGEYKYIVEYFNRFVNRANQRNIFKRAEETAKQLLAWYEHEPKVVLKCKHWIEKYQRDQIPRYQGSGATGEVPPLPYNHTRHDSPNDAQRAFYERLEQSLKAGRPISVDGNYGYLLKYTSEELARLMRGDNRRANVRVANAERVRERLTQLLAWYGHEPKFVLRCNHWMLDCILLSGKYHRYLELTEPSADDLRVAGDSNRRINLREDLGLPMLPLDYLRCFSRQVPPGIAKEHPALFAEGFEKAVRTDEDANGSWLDRIKATPGMKKTWHVTVFDGTPFAVDLPFKEALYYSAYDFFRTVVTPAIRDAENHVRLTLGLPKVGEGWVSETRLYHTIKSAFPSTSVIQHGRPDWLGRQHLDVWLPRWRVAVEYHGRQHFEPVEFFGGEATFQDTIERDRRKAELCEENGVTLMVVTENDEFEQVVIAIRKVIESKSMESPVKRPLQGQPSDRR